MRDQELQEPAPGAPVDMPYSSYRVSVPEQWIDINGHMNSTHYGLVIYEAHVLFTEFIGLGDAYVHATQCGKAVIESHMIYEREVVLDEELSVRSWLLAVDHKRMHFAHELIKTGCGQRAAFSEQLDIHMDLNARKSSPLPDSVFRHLQSVVRSCKAAPLPDRLGSTIRVPDNAWMDE